MRQPSSISSPLLPSPALAAPPPTPQPLPSSLFLFPSPFLTGNGERRQQQRWPSSIGSPLLPSPAPATPPPPSPSNIGSPPLALGSSCAPPWPSGPLPCSPHRACRLGLPGLRLPSAFLPSLGRSGPPGIGSPPSSSSQKDRSCLASLFGQIGSNRGPLPLFDPMWPNKKPLFIPLGPNSERKF